MHNLIATTVLDTGPAGAALAEEAQHPVGFHVNPNDTQRMNMALNNVRNGVSEEATNDPSGVVRLIGLQEQGYAHVRP